MKGGERREARKRNGKWDWRKGGRKGRKGGSCTYSPSPIRAKFGIAWSMLMCQISSELLYCVTLWGKVPQILLRLHIQDSVTAPFSSTKTTSNTGAQLQTFLYPTVSISFPYSNGLMAKLFAQTLPSKRVTDKK